MATPKKIRQPAVAGSFYPGDKTELKKIVDDFLSKVTSTATTSPKVIFVPHAGYPYSGQVAAEAFKRLENSGYRRAIIIGPSHHFPVSGLILSGADVWSTPVGDFPVAKVNSDLAKLPGLKIDDVIHEPEHALEIELPFLHEVLPGVEIMPIIVGRLNSAQQNDFAQVLSDYLDDQTVLIVSVDLSHYHPYQDAVALDQKSIEHILSLDDANILEDEIDAPWAVASVLKLAKLRGWQPKLIKYANSGDVTGDKSEVVGYGAIGFYQENGNQKTEIRDQKTENRDEHTEAEKKELLAVARTTIETYLKTGKTYQPKSDNPKFKEKRGVFVTLTESKQLRGCIGYIEPIKPLILAVRDNAIAAAVHDSRFMPLNQSELNDIKIEISILTLPQTDTVENIIKGKKGAILEKDGYGATYLPQVWEDLADSKVFFSTLCVKGGLSSDCYLDPSVKVSSYEAIVFHE